MPEEVFVAVRRAWEERTEAIRRVWRLKICPDCRAELVVADNALLCEECGWTNWVIPFGDEEEPQEPGCPNLLRDTRQCFRHSAE